MGIHVSEVSRRPPKPIAAWILGILGAVHGAGAFIFVTGARTPANELEGFALGTTAAVLLVGAILSYGLVRVRAEIRQLTPPR